MKRPELASLRAKLLSQIEIMERQAAANLREAFAALKSAAAEYVAVPIERCDTPEEAAVLAHLFTEAKTAMSTASGLASAIAHAARRSDAQAATATFSGLTTVYAEIYHGNMKEAVNTQASIRRALADDAQVYLADIPLADTTQQPLTLLAS